jgi:dTDP-glucose 4,6-dehydratase
MTILVTGGCGFIGTNFILKNAGRERIVNLDLLTYAGNSRNLASLSKDSYELVRGSVGDVSLVFRILAEKKPRAIVHFAAESHVDRSISGPAAFMETNVVGTFALLEASKAYLEALSEKEREDFRFLHVSTDEVYGSLSPQDPPFTEKSPCAPNSPYSASKASSDHFVRAYHRTYGIPTLTTHCSNNYGPYQFPEKLIPLMILNCLQGKRLPVYGDGLQVRDWLHVSDHAEALNLVLSRGTPGESYNIGGNAEKTNLEAVGLITALLDQKRPRKDGESHSSLIEFVKDRPGHDRRYAIDASKIKNELGFSPKRAFEEGLSETVDWYLENEKWTQSIISGEYIKWMESHYGKGRG